MLNKLNALIVDDDDITRFLHRRILNSLTDFEVTISEAVNGLEALKVIVNQYGNNKSIPDIILLDTSMPTMDGFDFIENLFELEFVKSIPIIIVSISDEESDKRKARSLGIKYFFTKPLEVSLLKNTIVQIIGQVY